MYDAVRAPTTIAQLIFARRQQVTLGTDEVAGSRCTLVISVHRRLGERNLSVGVGRSVAPQCRNGPSDVGQQSQVDQDER